MSGSEVYAAHVVTLVIGWGAVAVNVVLAVWFVRRIRLLRRVTAECVVETERLRAATSAVWGSREPQPVPDLSGRPRANVEWRCPACGLRALGYVPAGASVEFPCPGCGVAAEITGTASSS